MRSTDADTSDFDIDTSSDVMDAVFSTSSDNISIAHDLGAGNLDDEKWVLRFKATFSQITTTNAYGRVLISNEDQDSGAGNEQTYIGFFFRYSFGTKGYENTSALTTIPDNVAGVDVISVTWANQSYYFEVTRVSSTVTKVEVFTNSDYSTGSLGVSDNASVSASVTGLRYLKFMNFTGGGSADIIGTIDDVFVYTGVNVVPT